MKNINSCLGGAGIFWYVACDALNIKENTG
jgi:hypothetical protein